MYKIENGLKIIDMCNQKRIEQMDGECKYVCVHTV